MSQMLKCPNPSCPYVFDPALVPVGVVLSCPRCGMQFTLGPPNASASPPSPPTAPTGPATDPTAPTSQTDSASTNGSGSQRTIRERERSGRTAVKERPLAERPAPRSANNLPIYLLGGCAVLLMVGTFVVGLSVVIFRAIKKEPGAEENVTKMQELNVAIDPPPSGWTRDNDTRVKLGQPFATAYRREGTEAYMAFGAVEPEKGRSPRPSEMRRDLNEAFKKLQFDMSKFERETPPASTWLSVAISPDQPYPDGYKFRAQSNDGLNWAGEAYAVSHKGVAYYWLSWCGENDYDGLKDEFARFRDKFKLIDPGRNNWTELRSNVTEYKGDSDAVPYTISDAEGLWKEVDATKELPPLKMIEPDLDKRLRMALTPKRDRKAQPKFAELSVYVLPGAADAKQEAQRYAEELETRRIKEANPDFAPTFKELTEPPLGDPSAAPEHLHKSTPVVRLITNVRNAANANRLIVVSGIKSGERTVVVLCWCDAAAREDFETRFIQIASSLR